MIQTYKQINNKVEEYNRITSEGQKKHFGTIQKAYSSPHYISLAVRLPGETIFIYLGRGKKFEGMIIENKNLPSELRIRDRYLEYIRKYLLGKKIVSLDLDKKDRVLILTMFHKGSYSLFTLFWCGRDLYFTNTYSENKKIKMFESWTGARFLDNDSDVEQWKEEVERSYSRLGKKEIVNSGGQREAKDFDYDLYVEKALGRKVKRKFPGRKKKFFQRKILRIEEDFHKVQKWRALKEIIEQDGHVFPEEYEFIIADIKFKISNSENYFKKKDRIYKKIKAFRKAEDFLLKRLENTKEELSRWVKGEVYFEADLSRNIEPIWSLNKDLKKTSERKSDFVEYQIFDQGSLAVGKSAQDNDWLRKNWAKKGDLWFHIDGEKGAHAFYKSKNNKALSAESYGIIGSVLKEQSHYNGLDVPLIYSEVKNVKGVTGSAGKVTYKKEKYITIIFEANWKEIISSV